MVLKEYKIYLFRVDEFTKFQPIVAARDQYSEFDEYFSKRHNVARAYKISNVKK